MKFKKLLCAVLTFMMLICTVTSVMAGGGELPYDILNDNPNAIKVTVGGEMIYFDVSPQIINGRTMVPLRAIFDALGASVSWDDATKTVTSTRGNTTISLTIDSTTMYVNGTAVTLDSPACLIGGRTLVPVRAISEAFNLNVSWNESTKTVKVKVPVSLESETSRGY